MTRLLREIGLGWAGASRCFAGLLIAALALGCTRPQVTRSYAGVPRPERFIRSTAYAAFARGAEWQARDDLDQAIDAFELSVALDEDNVAARAELIGLYCRKRDLSQAARLYDEVTARDPDYAPAHYYWARCQTQRSGEHDALSAARRAVQADAGDERAVLLLVQQLVISGQHDEAIAWLRALVRRQPGSVAAVTALGAAAEGKQPAWAHWASARKRQLERDQRQLPATVERPLLASVDAALLGGRLSEARQLVRRAGSPPTLVALRALELGDPALAEREASLRLGADPSDFAARAVLAWALDQQGHPEQAANLLYAAPPASQLDSTSRRVIAWLLARHVGPEASQLWAAELTAPPPRASHPSPRKEATP